MEFIKTGKVFIIAELSANHNKKLQVALNTVKAAKRAGADAIKIQTYTPDTITLNVKKKEFMISENSIWAGKYLYDLYEEAYTPWEWHEEIFNLAKKEGLICFSSPFDMTAVDFLEELNVPIYKIASPEITDIPLIKYVAEKQKPIIISTGVATLEDIELAVETCKNVGNSKITLLQCTTAYPTPINESNLIMIKDLANRFGVSSGLSDHSLGTIVPIAAAVLGAQVIEKHFILEKSIGGPDASFSLDETEFTQMVQSVRQAEATIGEINYSLKKNKKTGRIFSRSLYISKNVKKGEFLSPDNVRSIRPSNGLHPKYYYDILGKKCKLDLEIGTPLSWELLE